MHRHNVGACELAIERELEHRRRRNEANAIARDDPRQLAQIVQLSSERARRAFRDGCSFAKKQEPPRALLSVVPSERVRPGRGHARIHA